MLKRTNKEGRKPLRAIVKEHFLELYACLQAIPSVGEKTTIEMIAVTEGFTKFESDKALSAYVGISPTIYSSGTSVRGRGVSHERAEAK